MASISLLSRTLRMSVSVLGRLPAISSTLAMALGNNRSSTSHRAATLTFGSLAKLAAWSLPRERIPMTATLTVSLALALAGPALRNGAAATAPAVPAPTCLTNLRRVIEAMVHTPFSKDPRLHVCLNHFSRERDVFRKMLPSVYVKRARLCKEKRTGIVMG